MVRNLAQVIMTLTVLVAASLASADIPDLDLSTPRSPRAAAYSSSVPTAPATRSIRRTLATAPSSMPPSLYLVNFLGDPLPGYPAEDLWLETTGGGLVLRCRRHHRRRGHRRVRPDRVVRCRSNAGGCTIGEIVVVHGRAASR